MDRFDTIDGRNHPFLLKDKDGWLKNKIASPITMQVELTALEACSTHPMFIACCDR